MTQAYERLVVFCPHCKYSTNRNFNLKRHLDSKHIDILLNNAKILKNGKNVIPTRKIVIPEEKNVILNPEIIKIDYQFDDKIIKI